MQTRSQLSWRTTLTLGAALFALVRPPVTVAQDLTAVSHIPSVNLDDDQVGSIASVEWQLRTTSDASNLQINHLTTNTQPFLIEAGAPSSSLHLRRDFFDQPTVGIGGVPADGRSLHIRRNDFPGIRLEQLVNPYRWDIQASNNSFEIQDATGNQAPFSIRSFSPSEALVVAHDGAGNSNVGIGGTPNQNVNLDIQSSFLPKIGLTQTAGTPYSWYLLASEFGIGIYDGTGGGLLPFLVEAGCPEATLHLESDGAGGGEVGVGTLNPLYPLHVVRSTATASRIAHFQQTKPNGTVAMGVQNAAPANIRNYCGLDLVLADSAGTTNAGRVLCSLTNTARATATSSLRFRVLNSGVATDTLVVTGSRVSIGTPAATHPLRVINANCNGSTWNNGCSRDLKQDVAALPLADARAALAQLTPVTYAYKDEPGDPRVGFIAEDVPALVAMQDGKSLCEMDLVAVLTKVVQDQSQLLAQQEQELASLRTQLTVQRQTQEQHDAALVARLAAIEAKLAGGQD